MNTKGKKPIKTVSEIGNVQYTFFSMKHCLIYPWYEACVHAFNPKRMQNFVR